MATTKRKNKMASDIFCYNRKFDMGNATKPKKHKLYYSLLDAILLYQTNY